MKRVPLLIALLFTSTLVIGVLGASSASSSQKKRIQPDTSEKNSIEQQRLDVERQKQADDAAFQKQDLALKKEQLEVQRSQIIWTALATFIPLLAVLLTLAYNAWSFRKQTQLLSDQRREDAKETTLRRAEDADLQFQLKASEIAFSGESPLEVQDRAKALKHIFPTRLSDNFLVDYDPAEFGEREGKLDSKKFFLELLLKYPKPEQQFETLSFWKEIFPGDVEWLRRINLSPHNPPTKPAGTSQANANTQAPTEARTEPDSPKP
jgi:hypothetical protein